MTHTLYPLTFVRAKLISETSYRRKWSADLDLKIVAECNGYDVVEAMANYMRLSDHLVLCVGTCCHLLDSSGPAQCLPALLLWRWLTPN